MCAAENLTVTCQYEPEFPPLVPWKYSEEVESLPLRTGVSALGMWNKSSAQNFRLSSVRHMWLGLMVELWEGRRLRPGQDRSFCPTGTKFCPTSSGGVPPHFWNHPGEWSSWWGWSLRLESPRWPDSPPLPKHKVFRPKCSGNIRPMSVCLHT